MEVLRVFESLSIQSHKGLYEVEFHADDWELINSVASQSAHFLVDVRIAELYAQQLAPVLSQPTTLLIEATEKSKTYEQVGDVINRLVENGVRRQHRLIAIGGGVIQDITCFIASTLLRGIPWEFFPTTLLAQADSCIGSKSSINLGDVKNVLGTFNPPNRVVILSSFLATLEIQELHSGIGEMLKVHAIAGPASFDSIAGKYDALMTDFHVLLNFIRESLKIKQRYIEADEFDQGIRNIFNYGHSFGHAIESATRNEVPHGIAVTLGMDIANFVAARRGLTSTAHFDRMHPTLAKNYAAYRDVAIPFERMLSALAKDKKNTTAQLGLIMPMGEHASIERVYITPDEGFRADLQAYFNEIMA